MFQRRFPFLLLPLVLLTLAGPTSAQTSEAARLKAELDALRAEFAQKIAAMEERLKAVEASAASPAAPTAPPAIPEAPAAAAPFAAAPSTSAKVFNPDIAAIGDFIGAAGKSPGRGEPSLSMHEAELSFQAIVDPYARADVFLTFGPEEVGIDHRINLRAAHEDRAKLSRHQK